jgi:methionyl-tRNA formyltransferase
MKNLFCGDYLNVLKVMCAKTGVDLVVIEEKNKGKDVHLFSIENEIEFQFVKVSEDLQFLRNDSWGIVFVASFGLLFNKKFIAKCQAIYNFHPGNIFNCRGRHPLPSAIKRKDSNIAISVHLISDEGIDSGPLFAQYFIALDYSKAYNWNYKRILKSLGFLANELCDCIKDGSVPLWHWIPTKESYQRKLSSGELELILSAEKLEDIKL